MEIHAPQDSLAHSMTDLMTSLMVIFILLFVVYLSHSLQETHKGISNRRDQLVSSLSQKNIIAKPDVRDPLSVIISVQDEKLQFDVGKAILKPRGASYLAKFIPNLTATLCSNSRRADVESLLIQGFTDSDGDDEHNLQLSQDRAFSVSKYALNSALKNPKDRECFLDLVSTNGRGERELLPSSSSVGKENKAMSRRVEFKIRVKSLEQKRSIRKQLES